MIFNIYQSDSLVEEIPGQWSEWTAWGPCVCSDDSCSALETNRTRDCQIQDARCGADCDGEETEIKICSEGQSRSRYFSLFLETLKSLN